MTMMSLGVGDVGGGISLKLMGGVKEGLFVGMMLCEHSIATDETETHGSRDLGG